MTEYKYKKPCLTTLFFRSSVTFNLENLREHNELIEALLKQELHALNRKAEEYSHNLDEEQEQEFHDWKIDEYSKLTDFIPDIQRQAVFISIYSFFESTLSMLCNQLQTEIKSPLSLADINGKGIEKAKTYIKKVALAHFPSDSNEWSKIKTYGLLRNTLVHNGGLLVKSNCNPPIY